jgi:hypothetical protein
VSVIPAYRCAHAGYPSESEQSNAVIPDAQLRIGNAQLHWQRLN